MTCCNIVLLRKDLLGKDVFKVEKYTFSPLKTEYYSYVLKLSMIKKIFKN